MEARYAFRKRQLLDECQIAHEMFEQVIPRLYAFMKPFVQTFQGQAAAQHAKTYVSGLLSDSSPYTFFLLNGDMELHRNRHLFIQKIFQKSKS